MVHIKKSSISLYLLIHLPGTYPNKTIIDMHKKYIVGSPLEYLSLVLENPFIEYFNMKAPLII